MNTVNQVIIDAVIAKAEKICPDALALIGIYGSVATGEEYAKSDLDLLILIENDSGYKLCTGFILDDSKIGYDIYCTSWESLQYDAQCRHAQLSKLLDSKIVYIKKQEAYEKLLSLREEARAFLTSDARFERVSELIGKAKISFADAHLHDELGQVRIDAYGVIYYLLDAVMLFHGTYFKRGVKRTIDELDALPLDKAFAENIKKIAASKDVYEIRKLIKSIIAYTEKHTEQATAKVSPDKNLAGTYEEMFSNWRNKVEEAAANSDVFASFMNMCSLQYMINDLANEFDIGDFDVAGKYDPDCLQENVAIYDNFLAKYEEIYKAAGIKAKRYCSVDEFICEYLN